MTSVNSWEYLGLTYAGLEFILDRLSSRVVVEEEERGSCRCCCYDERELFMFVRIDVKKGRNQFSTWF